MLTRMLRNTVPSLVALILLSGSASAASFSYGNIAGATVDFLNIQETTSGPDALFEAPVGAGDGLLFFPSQFAAVSGAQPTASSTLTMNIKAQAGLFLESITLEAVGDYAIIGVAQASVSAALDVLDVTPGTNGIFSTSAVVSPTSPFTSGTGQYSGSTTVSLAGLGISEVQISYVNTLTAAAQSGSAFIQNKVFNGPQISAQAGPAVPEPSAALVFAVGALLVGARARRPAR